MGTYTKVAITKNSIPPSKYDELVKFMEEKMAHEGGGINTDGYFITFEGRKFGRNMVDQKTNLAKKLKEIFEETHRRHWGEYNPQVFTKSEYSNTFGEVDWREWLEEVEE